MLFGVVMVMVVRPALQRFSDESLDETSLSLVVAGILTCSFVTSTIGVHEIFGRSSSGVVFPRGKLATAVSAPLSSVTHFLLPVFFVAIGLDQTWQLGLVLLVLGLVNPDPYLEGVGGSVAPMESVSPAGLVLAEAAAGGDATDRVERYPWGRRRRRRRSGRRRARSARAAAEHHGGNGLDEHE